MLNPNLWALSAEPQRRGQLLKLSLTAKTLALIRKYSVDTILPSKGDSFTLLPSPGLDVVDELLPLLAHGSS